MFEVCWLVVRDVPGNVRTVVIGYYQYLLKTLSICADNCRGRKGFVKIAATSKPASLASADD